MGATLTGYDLTDLPFALEVMEKQTSPGGFCQIQLCSEEFPSQEVVDKFYQDVLNTGHTISYPVCSISGEVAVTSFNIQREMPYEEYQWAMLVPLIGTLAIPALIAFGIVKIGDISAAIVPILLIAGGIIIITVALLRQPVTKYIESGRKIPYLPAATKPFKGGEDAEHYMRRLDDEVKDLWNKMCDYDKIPRDSKFAVFSKDNPYQKEYNLQKGEQLKWRRIIQSGGGLRHRAGRQYQNMNYLASTEIDSPKAIAAR